MSPRGRDPEHEIWDAETERDDPEPLSEGETQQRENAHEAAMDAPW